jgi:hypothetical protein
MASTSRSAALVGSATLEAESMRGSGKVVADKRASGDRARTFYRNGSASKQFLLPSDASTNTVLVRARGQACSGAPRMVLNVDGRRVASRLVRSQRWTEYAVGVGVTAGTHDLKVAFVNDRKTSRCDRELAVDRARFVKVQDAVVRRNLSELQEFTAWLDRENARGYVGEVGWSNGLQRNAADAGKWNAVAEEWYQRADDANLWVTVWGVDERQRWGGFWLSAYTSAGDGAVRPISKPQAQASVLEAHPTTEGYKRGVNVSGAEGISEGFSNRRPGVYGQDYWYASQETFGYLAGRGIEVVRLPFRWERIQPSLGGSLDPTELSRLKDCVRRAESAGLGVVLDVHNGGGYRLHDPAVGGGVERKIGSDYVDPSDLTDLWSRLSAEFGAAGGVVAYDLMNEPNNMPPRASGGTPARAWELASQAAVDAIRANGDGKLIMVPGYQYSGVWAWTANHPDRWITDSANNHMYEAHQYFDGERSGYYRYPYSVEVRNQG